MGKKQKAEYNEYTNNSVEWQKKRDECFSIYGKECIICGKTKKIHVHHKTYKRFRNEQVETDLIPLCEKHHNALHKFCIKYKKNLWQGTEEYLAKHGQGKSQLKRFKRKKQKLKRKKKIKKAKGNCGIRNFKYMTLPNDMKNFKAVVSVSLED